MIRRHPNELSVEEAEDLATSVLLAGLLVVHDAEGRREDEVAELTAGQDRADPLLEGVAVHVEARADGTALVQAAVQVHDDLAGAAVIDDLELADVTVLLHDAQELDDHLRDGAKEDLTLAAALSTRDGAEGVGQQ